MVKITVGAVSRNYFNMPLWVAVHQNMFRDEGLDVTLDLQEPIDEVWKRLQDGRMDIALGVTEQIILDQEAGGHLEIIGGNVNRLPFSLIAGKHIHSFEDMRGKVVGVSSLQAGSSSLIMKIFEMHGLHYPADYRIEEVGPILARWENLQSGKIDAGLQGAPLNYIAQDLGYPSLCEPREVFPWFQFTSLHVDGRWATANRETVLAFMRAFIRAHRWYYENKEACCRIAVAETGIDPKYANRAWDEYTQTEIFPRDARANPLSIQALIDVSALIRAVPNRAITRAIDYINHSYLDEAEKQLGS